MLPPLHPGLPVLGSLLDFRDDRAELLRRVAAEHPIARYRIGPITVVCVADPEHVGRVMSSNYRNYTKGVKAYLRFREVLGDGLLTSDGDTWAEQRRVAGPAFRADRIDRLAEGMREAGRTLAASWARTPEPDTLEDLQRTTMRVAGQAFLGDAMASHVDTIRLAFDEAISLTTRRIVAPVTPPLWVPTPVNRRFRRAVAHLDRVLGDVVRARRTAPRQDDVLGDFLDAGDRSDTELLGQVKTLFMAGFETLSNALVWSVYELGRHPEWRERLRDEAREAFCGPVTRGTFAALPLTRAVFCESLRRYPPVWSAGRTPVEDDVVGGFDIPRGSWVFLSPYATHHLPDHWPDPDRWDPDRFTPEREAARHRHAFMPFLAGPRKCIGDHFAMLEGVLVLASLVEQVDWETVGEVKPFPVVTLRPASPVRIRTRPV
ncbi:MAG: cytochrome P450 [Myxococcota bacterium]